MGLLSKARTAQPAQSDALSEADRVALHAIAKVRQFRKGEAILPGQDRSPSFYLVVDGAVEVFGIAGDPYGTPLFFKSGDVVGPIAPSEGVQFWIRPIELTTTLELAPYALGTLPERIQIWVYRTALQSYDRAVRQMRSANRNLDRKTRLLAERWDDESRKAREATANPTIKKFLAGMPKLPSYAMDLAAKLTDENTPIQNIVESIRQDPALAAVVMKRVNSARYAFAKRIESCYHACMILGTNAIHQLVLEEGLNGAIRPTATTRAIHSHSCLISAISYEIAQHARDVSPQISTTIGLLHDVGRSALGLLLEWHPEMKPFVPILDTGKIGAELAHEWKLSARIASAIEFQNQPAFMPPDSIPDQHRKDVTVLYLAHACEAELTGNPMPQNHTPFLEEHMEALGFRETSVAELCATRIRDGITQQRRKLPPEMRALFADTVFGGESKGNTHQLPASVSSKARLHNTLGN